jgi:SAM-dependent methyltransferase
MNDAVKEYYGKVLQGSHDLKTNACCTDTEIPEHLKRAMNNIHDEVAAHYYDCGLVSPQLLAGMRILDLGSGSGRDCYLLAQLVGEEGSVLGVDMTEEQLEVATRHIEWHRKKTACSMRAALPNTLTFMVAGIPTSGFSPTAAPTSPSPWKPAARVASKGVAAAEWPLQFLCGIIPHQFRHRLSQQFLRLPLSIQINPLDHLLPAAPL